MKVTAKQKQEIQNAINEVNAMSSRRLSKWFKDNYGGKDTEENMRKLTLQLMVTRICKGNCFRDQELLTEEIEY